MNIEVKVIQPSEFSGKLIHNFDFEGYKMGEEDAAGQKIKK